MGRMCLSLTELPEALPPGLPEDAVLELRVDAFDVLDDHALAGFVHGTPHDCLLTWRSPREGGHRGARPKGLWTWGLDWGFRWVDVESQELHDASPEALAVPPHRRWVSRHVDADPESVEAVQADWFRVCAHPAARHKLVYRATSFQTNTVLREWREKEEPSGPHAVFAQGAPGQPSRVLGGIAPQGTIFCSLPGRLTAPGQLDPQTLERDLGWSRLTPEQVLYGLLGFPARHSLSPRLHNRAFAATGVSAMYLPLESKNAPAVVEWMRRGWCRGLSVTAPFKPTAAALADRCTPGVERLGVANTLWMEGDVLWADNTDLSAAETLLTRMGLKSAEPVAVLGTGATARAAALALHALGVPARVYGRNVEAGEALARDLHCSYVGDLPLVGDTPHQALVNTVPADPGSWLSSATAFPRGILNLPYRSDGGETAWQHWARESETPFVGGRTFLVHQGVLQFNRWTGLALDFNAFKKGLET